VVTLTYTDNCGNSTTQAQNVIIEQIDVGASLDADGVTIVADNSDPGVTYQWIDCDGDMDILGATNQIFSPTYNGDFAVIVTQDGCSDTSDCITVSEVSLETLSSELLIIYPNPSTGQFTIDYDGGLSVVQMFDVLGRIVFTQSDIQDGAIDASSLAPGKYMVRVKTETDQIMVQPIVIGQN
jgi:hypothetical protein